jgi:hypothetical protein
MIIILALAHITIKFVFWFLLNISILPKMFNGSFGFHIQRFSLTFILQSSFFQIYCILFFSSLMISYIIDCSIITTYIDYGFPNINLEHFSDFSFNVSGEISYNNAIADTVNSPSSSCIITESSSAAKTTSTLTNNSTPSTNSSVESSNSTSSTSNSSSSNQNNKTLHKRSYSTALISSKAADAAIMITALSAGKAFMKHAPNLHTKAMVVGSSIMMGATAIVAKNAASNLSFDLGSKKNKFTDLGSSLAKYYDLTGNSVTDLLILIKYMQFLQLTILCFTLFYFV